MSDESADPDRPPLPPRAWPIARYHLRAAADHGADAEPDPAGEWCRADGVERLIRNMRTLYDEIDRLRVEVERHVSKKGLPWAVGLTAAIRDRDLAIKDTLIARDDISRLETSWESTKRMLAEMTDARDRWAAQYERERQSHELTEAECGNAQSFGAKAAAFARIVLVQAKHGPRGTGQDGPCDERCIKCLAERLLGEPAPPAVPLTGDEMLERLEKQIERGAVAAKREHIAMAARGSIADFETTSRIPVDWYAVMIRAALRELES